MTNTTTGTFAERTDRALEFLIARQEKYGWLTDSDVLDAAETHTTSDLNAWDPELGLKDASDYEALRDALYAAALGH